MWDPKFGELYSPIVEHLTAGVAVFHLADTSVDESLRVVGYNPAMQGFVPVDLSKSIGLRLIDLLPVRPEHIKAYAAVARGGPAIELGERRYNETNALPGVFRTRVAPLARNCVALILENLTQVERAERNLRGANEFLDAIVENIPDMIFVKEAKELRFERINRAGEKLLGVTRDKLLGKNDFDFFPPDQAQFFQTKDRDTFLSRTPVDVSEEPIQTPHGERWLHTKKVPLFDAQGTPRWLLGISEDITEQRQAAEQLKKLVKQLEESNAELDGFTHSISHDLRAPLRAMHGFANILIEDHLEALGPEGKRLADTIARNTVKMGALIDDLLNFSRLSRLQVERRVIDMAQMVRQTIAELDLEGRDVEFRVGELPNAAGDAAVMKQVWVNLIDNAVKYSRTRAKAIIEISGDVRVDFSVYRVKDNGVGYDATYANKLFGVFQRLHTDREYEGTGVGLALVQRIVQKHGGWITSQSVLDQGAMFEFAVPAQP